MKTHTVYLFDGKFYNIDQADYPNGIKDLENAMTNKTPIYLGESLVAGSAIASFEPLGYSSPDYGPHNMQRSLEGGLERLSLPEPRQLSAQEQEEQRIAAIKRDIRDSLRKIGGDNDEKRQYLATLRLAKQTQDTTHWKREDWDDFIARHPRPVEELEALAVQQSTPPHQREQKGEEILFT
jgi:hypothetical protein